MPRTTTGCWTCRARKKKCDDGRPACLSCTSRSITCYGYGAKPNWMDRGDLEKKMMDSIKLQIHASYEKRRSKTFRAHSKRLFQESATNRSPLLAPLYVSSPWSPTSSPLHEGYLQTEPHFTDDHGSISQTELHDPQSVSNNSSPQSSKSTSETQFPYTERELNMLMYYLDQMFPRMCLFFPYSAADNGRGWLLNLFLRTKPLCAAAVCLSECDRKQFDLGPLIDTPQSNHDLEMRHIQIVTDLRDHLSQLSEKAGARRMAAAVEALACIMHLIMFELWIPRKGITNDWVMHLDAASALLSSVALPDPGHAPYNSPVSTPSETLAENAIGRNFPVALLSEGEKSAFEFWLTQYTYFFINTAVNLGLTTKSAQSVQRTHAIFHRDQFRLKNMIGCEDWVMITLLDIAELKEWKQRMQNSGTLSLRELTRHANLIEERLKKGLATLASRKSLRTSIKDENQDMITTIYINSSLVFLYVVTSGFYPNLPEIRESVSRTLEALEHMRDRSSINFPTLPYCISGCLAIESDYPKFRALSPPSKKGTMPLVTAKWTLEILEECWKVRESQKEGAETCDWATAMGRLGTRLLLF